MTVPSQAPCDEDDDDMPPLEFVGAGAVPAPKTEPPASKVEEDDDDDEMPPLDYVGLTPGKGQEPEKQPKAAPAPAEAADDDDLPPLEYVGTGPAHSYNFREGSKVRLKGLSKADLNGQTGTILPFLNTTKDRLAVRLDSTGKNISIKPDNLESVVDAGPELTPEPRAADEDSDDSMPPLEAPAPKGVDAIPAAPEEDDDDDDMPPLEHVGVAAPAPAEDDDDDEMPPLEHVGVGAPAPPQAAAAPARPEAKFKEGDQVRLTGLSQADLNGQTGRIMSFSDASAERLPVKLDDSGKRVAIRPANLERFEPPAAQQAEEDDDDDMPPLEFVGTAAPAPAAAAPAAAEEEDDDEMPPLEFVGTAAAGGEKAKPQEEEDDDEMPPLEFVGVQPKAAAAQEEDNDEMPPLEFVGSSPSDGYSFKEGDEIILKGLSKAELNGKRGKIMPFSIGAKDRLPVKLEATQQRLSIKPENLELASGKKAQEAAPDDDDDDDDMPPLTHVGAQPAKASPPAADDDDDDDMPPLTYVGAQPGEASPAPNNAGAGAAPAAGGAAAQDSDEESMPPLEYAGTAAPERTGPASRPPETTAAEEEEDDDMPPLEYVGSAAAGASTQQPSQAEDDDDDDDMPPLEHVGCPAPARQPAQADQAAGSPAFKEGDVVLLKGLSKAELNGQRGTVMAFSGAGQGGRLPVRLVASGQKVSIKPENLERSAPGTATAQPAANAQAEDSEDDMPPLTYVGAGAAPETAREEEEDDDDLPPLEYVGATPTPQEPAQPKQPAPVPAAVADDDDDDDMPPLEYVGASAGGGALFKEGDAVVLKGLSKADLNGQRGTVMPFSEKANGRLPVRLASGEKVSIKPENLEKATGVAAAQDDGDDDDDDELPPLEYVGSTAQPAPDADDGAASDDSMPPLDYVGAAPPVVQEAAAVRPPLPPTPQQPPLPTEPAAAAQGLQEALRVGDTVVLGGLRTADLNGERARIVKEPDASESRVELTLLRTGKKLLVKWANITKAPAAESDEEESGKRPAAAAAKAGASRSTAAKSPEALLEVMRQAMQSSAAAPVVDALAQVEAAEGLDWGELLPRKKQILKKLRAKRRKLQPQDEESPAPPGTPERPAAPAAGAKSKATSGSSSHSDKATGRGEQDKNGKRVEEEWVVLSGAASPNTPAATAPSSRGLIRTAQGPKAAPPLPADAGVGVAAAAGQTPCTLRQWCQELQLPMELVQVLEAEEVSEPQELTGVPEEELTELTKGWKIGPKGRFMKAVRRMRAAEQAEFGSTCGSIA